MSPKTVFITGTNSGFGLAIATAAIEAGHTVIGTVRSEASREALAKRYRGFTRSFATSPNSISSQAWFSKQGRSRSGRCADQQRGYGHEGVLEESPIEEMRRQFDVNVFGAVAVAKAFLPRFRERRSGFIVNVTSMGGMITMPASPITAAASSRCRVFHRSCVWKWRRLVCT